MQILIKIKHRNFWKWIFGVRVFFAASACVYILSIWLVNSLLLEFSKFFFGHAGLASILDQGLSPIRHGLIRFCERAKESLIYPRLPSLFRFRNTCLVASISHNCHTFGGFRVKTPDVCCSFVGDDFIWMCSCSLHRYAGGEVDASTVEVVLVLLYGLKSKMLRYMLDLVEARICCQPLICSLFV